MAARRAGGGASWARADIRGTARAVAVDVERRGQWGDAGAQLAPGADPCLVFSDSDWSLSSSSLAGFFL